jgi:hypothetical protein
VSLKLPRQLTFAHGKAFARGATATADGKKLKGRALRAGNRTLNLKAKAAKRLRATAAKGAVVASAKVPRRSKFTVKVKDAAGKTTRIVARAP